MTFIFWKCLFVGKLAFAIGDPPPPKSSSLAYPAKPTPVSQCDGKDGIEFQNKRRGEEGGGITQQRQRPSVPTLRDAARNKQEFSNELHSSHAAFIFILLVCCISKRCHYMTMMDSFCQYQICYCCIFFFFLRKKKQQIWG